MIRVLIVLAALFCSWSSVAQEPASVVTPEWTERFLHATRSPLIAGSDADHVMSFYYFGRAGELTLMGLERVRGEDYEQFFSLMIFNGQRLEGYYQNVLSFPSGVSASGDVTFPRDVSASSGGQDFNLRASRGLPLCQTLRDQTRCFNWTAVGR